MRTHPYRSITGPERPPGESGEGETSRGLGLAMAIAEGAVLLLCFARLGVAVRRTSFAVEGALALVVGVLLVLRLSRRLRRSRVGGPFV